MLIKLDDLQLGWMAADSARVLAFGSDPLAGGEAARNRAVLARKAGWHEQAASIAPAAASSPILLGGGPRLAAERGLLIQSAGIAAAGSPRRRWSCTESRRRTTRATPALRSRRR
jgi:hypothetical protein